MLQCRALNNVAHPSVNEIPMNPSSSVSTGADLISAMAEQGLAASICSTFTSFGTRHASFVSELDLSLQFALQVRHHLMKFLFTTVVQKGDPEFLGLRCSDL